MSVSQSYLRSNQDKVNKALNSKNVERFAANPSNWMEIDPNSILT